MKNESNFHQAENNAKKVGQTNVSFGRSSRREINFIIFNPPNSPLPLTEWKSAWLRRQFQFEISSKLSAIQILREW